MKLKEKIKKYSIFQVVSFALIAILVVAIIVQIAIIIDYSNKINDLKNKNDQLPQTEVSSNYCIEKIDELNYKIFIDQL